MHYLPIRQSFDIAVCQLPQHFTSPPLSVSSFISSLHSQADSSLSCLLFRSLGCTENFSELLWKFTCKILQIPPLFFVLHVVKAATHVIFRLIIDHLTKCSVHFSQWCAIACCFGFREERIRDTFFSDGRNQNLQEGKKMLGIKHPSNCIMYIATCMTYIIHLPTTNITSQPFRMHSSPLL